MFKFLKPSTPAYLIVGLGNPGPEYRATRHNFGYMALDQLSERLESPLKRAKFQSLFAETKLDGNRVVLAKPITFMNESGLAVVQLMRYFKVPLEQLLVISDDLDLPLGALRIRPGGGPGGQKGVASIIKRLGTDQFARMRLGIGRPPGQMDPADYVLEKFLPSELEIQKMVLDQAGQAARSFVLDGLTPTMNKFNGEVG